MFRCPAPSRSSRPGRTSTASATWCRRASRPSGAEIPSPSPAKIILLHGASSSGKSTLARALRDRLDEPFWHISIDHLRDAGVLPSARINSGDFRWAEMRAPFFEGFHLSLRASAEAGNNLIVEHILDTAGWAARLAELLAPFDLFFVGLHCTLPELERREAARGDRKLGDAARDFATVHRGLSYDLELSSEEPLADNLERFLDAWEKRGRSRFSPRPAASSSARCA